MQTILSIFSNKQNIFVLFSVFLLLSFQACSRENDSEVIDFNKKIPETHSLVHKSSNIPLKFAVGAMISPKATFVHYRELLDYIGKQLDRPAQLVQRKTYSEINELLGEGEIDLAFICSGPYLAGKDKQGFVAVATPLIRGSDRYQSYLIVNRSSAFRELKDLKGGVFAFTDPDSLTGKIIPAVWLAEMGETPEAFFSKVIYTYSHDNSILAVAKGLVDGAAVDSLVWDYFQETDPKWTSMTRIIKKSDPYGIPPLVVSRNLPDKLKERLEQILFSMHQNPDGKKILAGLMIDRFTAPNEQWYEAIRQIEDQSNHLTRQRHATQDAQK